MHARFWCLLLSFPVFAAGAPCEFSAEAMMKYEQRILNAKNTSAAAENLACVLEAQEKAEDMTRYIAASVLRALFGGGQVRGVMRDARYRQAARALEQLTLKNKNPLNDSVVAHYARGDWGFYKLFCERGNTEFCTDFLPDETKVKSEAPLLAAASMMRLREAYRVLDGKQKEEVADRLKKLYREIPHQAKLQRKFIERIYAELFEIPISQV